MERPSGAGERRDKTLGDAEAKALGSPPPAPTPPSTPSSTPSTTPKTPTLFERVKKGLGLAESSHNPDNVAGESHGPDDRGFT